jgi:hypothetical protein
MKIYVEYMDQFRVWRRYTTKHNERDAARVALNRTSSTGARHRLVDVDGHLLDVFEPHQ